MASYKEILMTQYQVLRRDYEQATWLHKQDDITIRETPLEVDKRSPIIIGGDVLDPIVRRFLNINQPAIYISRGYLGNHLYKTRRWWRYSINGWANTKIRKIPHSRWKLLDLPMHPWKVKQVKNVLLAPSKLTSRIWDPVYEDKWIYEIGKNFPGAEIKIRPKESTPNERWQTLWQDLDWADLVVAQGSAITAEAFWYGKKVISLYPCTTWITGKQSIENWQDPAEPPLRNLWHEHVAWSQFTNEELHSGEALRLIKLYYGNILSYNPDYRYNLEDLKFLNKF